MSMIADNPTWTVADRLRRARILAGMDQADVSRALHVSRTAISSWEQGHTEPSASNFVRFARLTGQPLEWLAAGVDEAVNDETPRYGGGAGRRGIYFMESHLRESNPRPIHYMLQGSGTAADAFWSLDRLVTWDSLTCQVEPDSESTYRAGVR